MPNTATLKFFLAVFGCAIFALLMSTGFMMAARTIFN